MIVSHKEVEVYLCGDSARVAVFCELPYFKVWHSRLCRRVVAGYKEVIFLKSLVFEIVVVVGVVGV